MDQAAVYKKKIRYEAMKISFSYIFFYVVYSIAAVIFAVFYLLVNPDLRGLITGSYGSRGVSSDEITYRIMESLPLGWLSIFALLVGSLVMLIVRGKKLFSADLTKTSSKMKVTDFLKMAGTMLGISAVISLFYYLLYMFIGDLFPGSGEDPVEALLKDHSGVLYVVLLGPILEEIIFRGAILRSLERFGQNFAIVVSSLMFGLYHLALFQGFFAFFIGLILAYCTIRFSIKWAMALHILNNGYAVALYYLPGNAAIELGILLLVLALGVLAVFFSVAAFKEQLRRGKPTELHFAVGEPIVPYYLSPADPRVAPYVASAMMRKARPYQLMFSSPWFIVALSLVSAVTVLMTFLT